MTAVSANPRTATVKAASTNIAGIFLAQLGAATASTVFDEAPPVVVSFGRQAVCAIALLLWARPQVRGRGWRSWGLIATYGANMTVMNLTLYESIKRLPLGTAITIELLGPIGLAVALSRGVRQFAWATLAVVGVGLVRGTRLDGAAGLGLVFALVAAGGWACYILLTKRMGRRFSSLEGTSLAMVCAATLSLPFAARAGLSPLVRPTVIGRVAVAGMLSSLIPMAFDLRAMRVMPARVAGVVAGLAPVLAGLVGVVFLSQPILARQAIGMILVVVSAAGVVLSARPEP